MEGIIGSEILKSIIFSKKGAILVFAGMQNLMIIKQRRWGKMFKLDIKRIELLDNELSEKS